MSIEVAATTAAGLRIVLAFKRDEDSPVAQCASRGCPVAIQRTVDGDLVAGVRAHYRTVHPERRVK